MASAPTQPTSTNSELKCPSCNFVHRFRSVVSSTYFVQFNTAREIFGVTTKCPVCLDECSGLMALSCGHILCKDDYQRMGRVMPTLFDSATLEKSACDIFLRRSDATTNSSPWTLTFSESIKNTPILTVTATGSTTTTAAAHSSTFSLDPAARLRRMTEQALPNEQFSLDEANVAIGSRFSGVSRPPIANGHNAQSSTVTAPESSGASRLRQFVYGEANAANIAVPPSATEFGAALSSLQSRLDTNESSASTNAHSSYLTTAGSTGITYHFLIQENGASVAAPQSEPVGRLSLSEGDQTPLPRRIPRSASRVNVPSSDSAAPRRSKRATRPMPV